MTSGKVRQGAISLIKDLLIVGVIFLIFTTFAFASFHIPSGSMEPTLEVGDRIMVSKFSYGYNRYSFLMDPDFIGEDRIIDDRPERGDVVVFTLPHKDNRDFIKRVIGLPGDRIKMLEGRLYINGVLVPRKEVRKLSYTSYEGREINVTEYLETLPNGVTHRIYERTDRGQYDGPGDFVVPPDHYFMMGDNRDASGDSRSFSSMGPVHHKYLVGRARFTTFSLYDCDQGKPITCPAGIPLGRFFSNID